MKYKGYEGVVEFDDTARIFHGEVMHIRDVVTFQGISVEELEQAFRDSVDDYLEFCAARGEDPEKPYSGNLVLRIKPELHREITYQAKSRGMSVNAVISEAIEAYAVRKK